MLVQFFKNNNPSSFILVSLLAMLLWVNGFVLLPSVEVSDQMYLFGLFNNFHFHPSFLNTLIALLLVLGEAFLLNFMVNKYEILSKSSFLPALFYIILMSMDSGMLLFYPSIISNFLILLIIYVLLESYRKDIAFSNAFDAGALCSTATLFYPPTIILFPVLGIGLFILRPFNWREWVICLIGICAPYLFVFCYYFWTDQLHYFWNYPFFRTTTYVNYSSSLLTVFSIVILIILLSISKLTNNLRGGSQKKSKGTLFLIWLAVLSALSLYWAPSVSCCYLSLFIIPVSVFCAEYIASVKKKWWGEFLFAILFISIIVNLMSVYF
jgi:hypothetical protein